MKIMILQELLRSTLAQYQAQFEAMSAVSPIAPPPPPHPLPVQDKSEQKQSSSSSSAPPDDELVRWLQDLSLSDQTIKQASSNLKVQRLYKFIIPTKGLEHKESILKL